CSPSIVSKRAYGLTPTISTSVPCSASPDIGCIRSCRRCHALRFEREARGPRGTKIRNTRYGAGVPFRRDHPVVAPLRATHLTCFESSADCTKRLGTVPGTCESPVLARRVQ